LDIRGYLERINYHGSLEPALLSDEEYQAALAEQSGIVLF
jgi:hypothetical protein